jgi:hypothetical protein
VQDGGNDGAHDRGRHVQPDVGEIARCDHGAERSGRVESGAVSGPPIMMLRVTAIPIASGARLPAFAPLLCPVIITRFAALLCTDTRVPCNALVM